MKLLGVQLHVPTLPIFDLLPRCAKSFTDKEKKKSSASSPHAQARCIKSSAALIAAKGRRYRFLSQIHVASKAFQMVRTNFSTTRV
jgi:hypothetical protein